MPGHKALDAQVEATRESLLDLGVFITSYSTRCLDQVSGIHGELTDIFCDLKQPAEAPNPASTSNDFKRYKKLTFFQWHINRIFLHELLSETEKLKGRQMEDSREQSEQWLTQEMDDLKRDLGVLDELKLPNEFELFGEKDGTLWPTLQTLGFVDYRPFDALEATLKPPTLKQWRENFLRRSKALEERSELKPARNETFSLHGNSEAFKVVSVNEFLKEKERQSAEDMMELTRLL